MGNWFLLMLWLVGFQAGNIDRLSWISGCWEGRSGDRVTVEQWMKPDGGLMIGMSRTVVAGKASEFEFLQIRQQGTDVVYIAKPSGQAEGSFKLAQSSDREAVFENPTHDFPQRIIYRLQPDSSLLARIEGVANGVKKGIDYPMKRTQCP